MLTNNYILLSKSFKSQGCYVHTASADEYMNITIQRCRDEDFVRVNQANPEVVNVRIDVGKNDESLYYKFSGDLDTFLIKNIPIYKSEEAWIAIDQIDKFCVFGHVSKTPF